MALADRIDALLPQTQCRRCGFPTCRDYAEALAEGRTALNRCPPGGRETIEMLCALTARSAQPLDPECGTERPRRVAEVEDAWCIGCTLCIQACPVDAIVGGAKRMHTVLERLCTGCELCLEPCPVDCIVMVPASSGPRTPRAWLEERAPQAARRFAARRRRLAEAPARRSGRAARDDAAARRAVIEAAVSRVRARRSGAAQ